MDLNMPIMDGYEACKQIIQLYKEYNKNKEFNFPEGTEFIFNYGFFFIKHGSLISYMINVNYGNENYTLNGEELELINDKTKNDA